MKPFLRPRASRVRRTPRLRDAKAPRTVLALLVALGGLVLPVAGAIPASAQEVTTTWTQESSLPSSVGERAFFASAVNTDTGEIVIVGGENSSSVVLADTRICKLVGNNLDVANPGTWQCRTVSPGPPARRYASLAYDPVLKQFVLFGGANGSWTRLSDTWVLTGEGLWQQKIVSGPSARDSAMAVYDPAEQGILLAGGNTGSGMSDETWVWNGLSWSLRDSDGPGLHLSGIAYDPTRARTMLFGGEDASTRYNTTYVWDAVNDEWDNVTPASGNPPARRDPGMTFSPAQGGVVLFGGLSSSNVALADTWVWDGDSWAALAPLASPAGRHGADLHFEPTLAKPTLIGGTTNGGIGSGTAGALDEAWTLRPAVQLPSPSPGVYPSHDCVAPSGNVIDGFLDGAHVLLRTDAVGGQTWVCVHADNGTVHAGGKAVVSGAVGVPTQDDNFGACDADPANRIVNEDGFVGPVTFEVDVNQYPTAVWVCVTLMGSTGKRVIIPTSGTPNANFLPDSTTPFPYVETPAPVGKASSACQNAASGKTRLVNAKVGTNDVWAYTWQESLTKVHACVRVQGATNAGGRLTLDGGGSQSFVTTDASSDFGPCDMPIAGTTTPPILFKAHAGLPAWVCGQVLNTFLRVKLDTGGQGIVTFTQDT